MAGSPQWKVYEGDVYQAACKEPEAAAALVAFYGEGSSIRDGHSAIVWREGLEDVSGGESYDHCAEVCRKRSVQLRREAYVKRYGQAALDRLLSQQPELKENPRK